MTMQHLPRPWMLAALTDVPVAFLAQQNAREADADREGEPPPRAEARRRRLSTRHLAQAGADQGRGIEAERAA